MILVTGGTGLLGSHLLFSLAREHNELVALKRPSSDLEEVKRVFAYNAGSEDEPAPLFGRIRWVDAHLLNQAEMEEALEGISHVYHCAAMVSFQPRDRQKMIRFNTDSTACLVNACLAVGVQKLLHVSSTSAIGRSADGLPATEDMIWAHGKTSTGYALSKFRSEMEVWRGMEEGLNAVIVNPSIILGAGFWDRGSSSMFSRVAGGLKYAAPGVTGYVGVQDVVHAMIRLMHSDISGERFIISEGNYSYAEIFGMIAASLGVSRDLKKVSPTLLWNLKRLDSIAAVFRGIRLITSEHVRAAFGEVHFSSEKVKTVLGMEFTPLGSVIEDVAAQYRKDHPV
jgi:nucleoside-diphosphate-sugar epimerase